MSYRFETLQLHAGQEKPDSATGARAVPIYLTSSYVFDDSQHAADRFALKDPGNIYGRLTNPTVDAFEQRVAALEGGIAALATASGLAAITYAILTVASGGNNIVSTSNIYGGTFNLLAHTLPNYGITTKFIDPANFTAIENAIDENTRALYAETLGNPNSDIADIDKLAEIAHKHHIPLIIDSTFTPPSVFRPQIVEFLPKRYFERMVSRSKDRTARMSPSYWSHMLVIMYGQLTGCHSLRELTDITIAHAKRSFHLGFGKTPIT